MNIRLQKLRSISYSSLFIFLIIATIVFLVGIKLVPGLLAFYYQLQAGKLVDTAQKTVYGTDPFAIPCIKPAVAKPDIRRKLTNAIGLLNRAEYLNHNLGQAYLLLGRVYCMLGQPDAAILPFRNYTQLHPSNPLGHIELGFAYAQMDDNSALAEWRKGGVQQSNFPIVQSSLARDGKFGVAMLWNRYNASQLNYELDALPKPVPEKFYLLESFYDTYGWTECAWCYNGPGLFAVHNGILEMSYTNIPKNRQNLAYLTRPLISQTQYDHLEIRLRGEKGTLLTLDVIVDGILTRLYKYSPVPQKWENWTAPISPGNLQFVLISISELPNMPQEQPQRQVFIDWIALE